MAYEVIKARANSSNHERTGTRCTAYSTWHRTNAGLRMVDIDAVEICAHCQKPLAVIETARNGGRYSITTKPHQVTRYIARMLQVPGFVLFYDADAGGSTLVTVAIRQIAPEKSNDIQNITPDEWAQKLAQLHTAHAETCERRR